MARIRAPKCALCKHTIPMSISQQMKLRDLDPMKLEFPSFDSMNRVETDEGPMHKECAEQYESSK